MEKQAYNIDRKTASKLLKVSIRTLDRYLKAKKLSSQVVDGRIWLEKGELVRYRADRDRPVMVDKIKVSRVDMSTDVDMDNSDKIELVSQDSVDTLSTTPRKKSKINKNVYKKLFAELKEEIQEKQERLEIANYRVGQLETQVRNSVPMLEYHRENYQRSLKEEELGNQLTESADIIKKISTQLRYVKMSKRVYIGIMLVIIALQPLWLLFLYNGN